MREAAVKRGLRKLCDVPADAAGTQRETESRLFAANIRFETYWHYRWPGGRHDDFLRYAVNARDLRAALDLLPLALRGFRPVGDGAHKPPSARRLHG